MSQELAEQYAEQVKHLALKARGIIRDLEPTNELQYLRIRAKKHEVMVAYGKRSVLFVPADISFCILLARLRCH
jgi:dynein light chain roadblock-type